MATLAATAALLALTLQMYCVSALPWPAAAPGATTAKHASSAATTASAAPGGKWLAATNKSLHLLVNQSNKQNVVIHINNDNGLSAGGGSIAIGSLSGVGIGLADLCAGPNCNRASTRIPTVSEAATTKGPSAGYLMITSLIPYDFVVLEPPDAEGDDGKVRGSKKASSLPPLQPDAEAARASTAATTATGTGSTAHASKSGGHRGATSTTAHGASTGSTTAATKGHRHKPSPPPPPPADEEEARAATTKSTTGTGTGSTAHAKAGTTKSTTGTASTGTGSTTPAHVKAATTKSTTDTASTGTGPTSTAHVKAATTKSTTGTGTGSTGTGSTATAHVRAATTKSTTGTGTASTGTAAAGNSANPKDKIAVYPDTLDEDGKLGVTKAVVMPSTAGSRHPLAGTTANPRVVATATGGCETAAFNLDDGEESLSRSASTPAGDQADDNCHVLVKSPDEAPDEAKVAERKAVHGRASSVVDVKVAAHLSGCQVSIKPSGLHIPDGDEVKAKHQGGKATTVDMKVVASPAGCNVEVKHDGEAASNTELDGTAADKPQRAQHLDLNVLSLYGGGCQVHVRPETEVLSVDGGKHSTLARQNKEGEVVVHVSPYRGGGGCRVELGVVSHRRTATTASLKAARPGKAKAKSPSGRSAVALPEAATPEADVAAVVPLDPDDIAERTGVLAALGMTIRAFKMTMMSNAEAAGSVIGSTARRSAKALRVAMDIETTSEAPPTTKWLRSATAEAESSTAKDKDKDD